MPRCVGEAGQLTRVDFTPTETRIIHMRIRGYTWKEIGADLGISKQAVHRHLKKPKVKEAIQNHGRDVIEAARQRLAEGYRIAIDAMISIAADEDHPQRLAAARHLVQAVDGIRAEIVVSDVEQRQRAAAIAASLSDEDLQIAEAVPLTLEGE